MTGTDRPDALGDGANVRTHGGIDATSGHPVTGGLGTACRSGTSVDATL